MINYKKLEEQISQIEDIVQKDSTNGRHLQKRLRSKLSNLGSCPDNVCKQIEQLKKPARG